MCVCVCACVCVPRCACQQGCAASDSRPGGANTNEGVRIRISKIRLYENALDLVEIRERPNVTRDIRQLIIGHILQVGRTRRKVSECMSA
jgi:hypothetical protein